ncbi:hypothetical protein [Legionella cincinnatiensis]|uniref:Uncharacterized protein n=1 Tax=Legionella cincinnatiensis TaxID=28085 RepID=A0A378IT18_9GAMM|nr:hypothetical protein [Legionella cincinnatiensis]KTC93928.1 hypothetical protein Lcin_0016 [Legionella cincinnatiensis]STX35134.1 Uncharacterised protein [Legionella cincinnatiensis]
MKNPYGSKEYNALFQENESEIADPQGRLIYDKGISCHVFAIASPIHWATCKELNNQYSEIGMQKELERAMNDTQPPIGEELKQERQTNMDDILQLRNNQETCLHVEKMYLCGGFREGKSCPEHMWLEDVTNNMSLDTFINRNGIALRNCTGEANQGFQPGCEGHQFEANDIMRVKVPGYTYGQLVAIAAGSERRDALTNQGMPKFPPAIADTPQVLTAIAAVNRAREALNLGGDRNAARNAAYVHPDWIFAIKNMNSQLTDLGFTPATIQHLIDHNQAAADDHEKFYQATLKSIERFTPHVKNAQDLIDQIGQLDIGGLKDTAMNQLQAIKNDILQNSSSPQDLSDKWGVFAGDLKDKLQLYQNYQKVRQELAACKFGNNDARIDKLLADSALKIGQQDMTTVQIKEVIDRLNLQTQTLKNSPLESLRALIDLGKSSPSRQEWAKNVEDAMAKLSLADRVDFPTNQSNDVKAALLVLTQENKEHAMGLLNNPQMFTEKINKAIQNLNKELHPEPEEVEQSTMRFNY